MSNLAEAGFESLVFAIFGSGRESGTFPLHLFASETGFMAAMTMTYPVKVRKDQALQSLAPGDEITADLVVDSNGVSIENIMVVPRGCSY